jgi:hypothetical protein
MQCFTIVLARLSSNALGESARCHAYVAHLLPLYRAPVLFDAGVRRASLDAAQAAARLAEIADES